MFTLYKLKKKKKVQTIRMLHINTVCQAAGWGTVQDEMVHVSGGRGLHGVSEGDGVI